MVSQTLLFEAMQLLSRAVTLSQTMVFETPFRALLVQDSEWYLMHRAVWLDAIVVSNDHIDPNSSMRAYRPVQGYVLEQGGIPL